MPAGRNPDVLIVGGGIFGASIACFLAEHRVGEILLLERGHLASGATGVSSAIVRVHYTNPWESRLAHRSLQVFQAWADRIGGSCGYRRTGFLRIVGAEDRDCLRWNVEMVRAIGANAAFIEPHEVHELQPALCPEGIGGAAYEPDGGFADGPETAGALIDRAVERGTTVRCGVTATAILVAAGRARGVETDRGFVPAGCIVVAAGAWSISLLRQADLLMPLRSRLIRAGLLAHAPDAPAEHMTIIDDSIGTYLKPERANRTEFGLPYSWDVAPSGGSEPVPVAVVADAAPHLLPRVPALAQAGVVRGWGACDGFTPDGAPLLGKVPEVEGLYVAVGASGTGFKIAPAVGMGIAELIASGHGQEVDLEAFRPSRFSEGDAIRSPTEYRRPDWRSQPVNRRDRTTAS